MTPSCRLCGDAGPSDPGAAGVAGWVSEQDGWLCPSCARRHVRDIEARLDSEWW